MLNSLYNLKRRITSLPPIALDVFDRNTERKIEISDASLNSRSSSSENGSEEIVSPFQCLFCDWDFASNDAGFAANLEHMGEAHGMSIPHAEMVVDLQSFVEYLATEVRAWHECLYCGATKASISSIQSHMRDKGHCLLNLDREPELLDFWENSQWVRGESATTPEPRFPIRSLATKISTASSKVIGSRHAPDATRKAPKIRSVTSRALSTGLEAAESSLQIAESHLSLDRRIASDRQLCRREDMSLQGISVQQRQTLILAEKKAQRSEAVARRIREWVRAKGTNSQKFDQLDNRMKFGKQNHKLLPR